MSRSDGSSNFWGIADLFWFFRGDLVGRHLLQTNHPTELLSAKKCIVHHSSIFFVVLRPFLHDFRCFFVFPSNSWKIRLQLTSYRLAGHIHFVAGFLETSRLGDFLCDATRPDRFTTITAAQLGVMPMEMRFDGSVFGRAGNPQVEDI